MVTAVKYRKTLLNRSIEDCVKETLKGISERYKIIIDEYCSDRNHIHIFCGAPPRLSPLRIISIINPITAGEIFKQFPKLKKDELWGNEFWNAGKYIGTVLEAAFEKVIINYIKNQSPDKNEANSRMKQLKLFNL